MKEREFPGSLYLGLCGFTAVILGSFPGQGTKVSWQDYRSGWPFPSPGELSHPGIEPESPALQADSLPTELQNYGFILTWV